MFSKKGSMIKKRCEAADLIKERKKLTERISIYLVNRGWISEGSYWFKTREDGSRFGINEALDIQMFIEDNAHKLRKVKS